MPHLPVILHSSASVGIARESLNTPCQPPLTPLTYKHDKHTCAWTHTHTPHHPIHMQALCGGFLFISHFFLFFMGHLFFSFALRHLFMQLNMCSTISWFFQGQTAAVQITLKPFALGGLGPYSVCGVEAGGSGFPMGHINPIQAKKKISRTLCTLTDLEQGMRLPLTLKKTRQWPRYQ